MSVHERRGGKHERREEKKKRRNILLICLLLVENGARTDIEERNKLGGECEKAPATLRQEFERFQKQTDE